MARTVDEAFNSFLRDSVNLDSVVVAEARDSRDNLLDNIAEFGSDSDFFRLHSDFNIQFGSFARGTKLRPLDDIDLMIGLSACGATYEGGQWDNIQIIPSTANETLLDHTDTDGTLNSIRLLNTFKSRLRNLPDYCRSDIHRNQEAIVLNLISREWAFDIVPCFFTKPESDGRTYYLIPNGNGAWKKTDPRLDKEYVDQTNEAHGQVVKELVRLCKYWNRVKRTETMPSYLLETIIVQACDSKSQLSDYVDFRFAQALLDLKERILCPVNDMKKIQGDLNTLSAASRRQIADKAENDYDLTQQAWQFEQEQDHRAAINKWQEVFGQEFPKYG